MTFLCISSHSDWFMQGKVIIVTRYSGFLVGNVGCLQQTCSIEKCVFVFKFKTCFCYKIANLRWLLLACLVHQKNISFTTTWSVKRPQSPTTFKWKNHKVNFVIKLWNQKLKLLISCSSERVIKYWWNSQYFLRS